MSKRFCLVSDNITNTTKFQRQLVRTNVRFENLILPIQYDNCTNSRTISFLLTKASLTFWSFSSFESNLHLLRISRLEVSLPTNVNEQWKTMAEWNFSAWSGIRQKEQHSRPRITNSHCVTVTGAV